MARETGLAGRPKCAPASSTAAIQTLLLRIPWDFELRSRIHMFLQPAHELDDTLSMKEVAVEESRRTPVPFDRKACA